MGTARIISVKANKSVNTILNMPLDSAWLFIRGQEPQQVKKYQMESHLPCRQPSGPAASVPEEGLEAQPA